MESLQRIEKLKTSVEKVKEQMATCDSESDDYKLHQQTLDRLNREIKYLEYKGVKSYGSLRGMLQHMYKGETIILHDDDVKRLVIHLHDYANFHIKYDKTIYNEVGFPSISRIKEKDLELDNVLAYIHSVFESRRNINIAFG